MKGSRVAVVGCVAIMISLTAFPPPPATAGRPSGPVVFLDQDGNVVRDVNFTISFNSSTQSLKVVVNTEIILAIMVDQDWVDSRIPDVALENVSYSLARWDSRTWYRVELAPGISYLDLHLFTSPTDRSVYSRGSQSSIRLERAMFIRIEAKPSQLTLWSNTSNSNGTSSRAVTRNSGPLVLNLTDRNTTGQEVRLSESWLSSFGIGEPSFLMSGGEDVPFEIVGGAYVLRPPHFSFIYAFSGDEHFRKETDFEDSEVFWDEEAQNIFLRSDRRDSGDEWFSRHLPQEIDSTTLWKMQATWTPTVQGNYQVATPLFLASSRDASALQPSGVYFWYYSRNSQDSPPCWDCNPKYYMFYYDQTGVARIYDTTFEGERNVPYKLFATYDTDNGQVTMQIKSMADAVLHDVRYTIGTNPGDDFRISEQKIGGAAKFITKLWNVARFISSFEEPSAGKLQPSDEWILAELNRVIESCRGAYEDLNLFISSNRCRDFLWNLFAPHYVEMVKARAYEGDTGARWTLHACLRDILRLLAPIIPFSTDAIWRSVHGGSVHAETFPMPRDGIPASRADFTEGLVAFNADVWKRKRDQGLSLNVELPGVEVPGGLKPFETDLRRMHHLL